MKEYDWLDLSIIGITVFVMALVLVAAVMYELRHHTDLQNELHTPRLDDWNILASGDLYILSYPTACKLDMQSNMAGARTTANVVSIACPYDSYIAIVAIADYGVFCNGTTVYEDWSTVNNRHGYTYVYQAKALSCRLDYSPYDGDDGDDISPADYAVYTPN
jgi:hypothetical protein